MVTHNEAGSAVGGAARTTVECPYEFSMELRSAPGRTGVPLHREGINTDLPHLVDETFNRGVMADLLPGDPEEVQVGIAPCWDVEPDVGEIEIALETRDGGSWATYTQRYRAGRWVPRVPELEEQLRSEATLGKEESTHLAVLAESGRGGAAGMRLPPLRGPRIVDQSLEECGVRGLGEGSLVPDRPVLVSDRLVADALEATRIAGAAETGGGVLGKIVRLPEPLPGTRTPVVTILSALIQDRRHVGQPGQFTFSTDALVHAAEIGSMRELGETVLTALHTHGWGTGCEMCNENAGCLLPQCTEVSVQDYRMIESLFPDKASLMPIAGRRLGAPGQQPVLEVHAWRGGLLRRIRWQRYRD